MAAEPEGMLLVLDIGNTNIVVGVFDGDSLHATWRLATEVHKTEDEYAGLLMSLLSLRRLDSRQIRNAVIASVVPPLISVFHAVCTQYLGVEPLVVQAGIRTSVRVVTENPREVGADRVANAVAAHRLYGGPAIVIDFGTATTFDAISPSGDYLGGAIAPGLVLSAEALFRHTAKLPDVEIARPRRAIGRDTVAAMQSGILFGYVGLIEGLVARISKELEGKPTIVATGGWAELVAKETKIIEVVNPDLTLQGLRMICELNTKAARSEVR